MADPLQACMDRFGSPPRNFRLADRLSYLRVPKPLWLRLSPADGMKTLFQNLPTLFSNGIVVWGHVIQANQLMFQAGTRNCPGEVVYSLEDANQAHPEELQRIAHALYSFKGTAPTDPELMPIANYLTDEMVRVFGLKVPRSVSPQLRCRISTTFFVRKHLPQRQLCSLVLPMVVNPREPHVALPLPDRFWPEELIAWWTR